MKTFFISLVLATVTLSSAFGQSNYSFSKAGSIYSPLDNPTVISPADGWNDIVLPLNLGTTINFMGTQTDSLLVLEGILMNYGTFDATGQFSQPETPMLTAAGIDLIDKAGEGTPVSESVIGYKLSGNSGDHLLKIEFKDVSFETAADISSNTASFQIWYYESDQKIEYHYGNSSFTDWVGISSGNTPEGMQVSLCSSFDYNNQTGTFLFLDGDEATPSSQVETISPSNIPGFALNQFPVEGTIYRFEKSGSTVGVEEFGQTFLVYPNPSQDYIFSQIPTGEHITIYNAQGKLVMSDYYSDNGISISKLPTGVYIIKTDKGQSRFVKQ